ncbi:MAG: DUF1573 domain-containing protein [Bacteroidales bacterium]|nr:DUF1573 domain-containing protein [Bacteroidales bacterium]
MNKGLIWILTLVLMVSCGRRDGELSSGVVSNPVTADGESKGDLPEITFEKPEHDFGRIIQGEKVSCSFKFTNTGKSDLIISAVSSICGCTVPTFPKDPVRPGAEGKLSVTFDSEGRKGFQTKIITVLSNSQPNTKQLRIKAQIIEP